MPCLAHRGLLTAVVALSIAGCSDAGPASSADPRTSRVTAPTTSPAPSYGPAVAGMTALAYRTRVDEAEGGRFQIKLTNTGAESFTVVSTGLDSAGFTPLLQNGRSTLFRPGARIDLPTPYGEVRCGPDQPAEPAYAVLDVVRPDGSRERLRVPMPSDYGVLTRIHDEGCTAQRLAEDVTVEFVGLDTESEGKQQVVTGILQLTRGDTDADIAVSEVRGSVLYDVVPAPGTTLPQTLRGGQTTLAVPIAVSPATCEAHVIGETKKPFVFPLFLALDDAEPLFSLIPVSEAQRQLLYDALVVACGL